MDPMDRVDLGNPIAMAKRHCEERERCGLSLPELHRLLYRFSIPKLKEFEKYGKVPADSYASYLCSLAIHTEMDVLYILCGEYLPIRSRAKDKRLWALLASLSLDARGALLAEAEQLFAAQKHADEERYFLLQHGEEYRGVVIADLDGGLKSPRIDGIRRFVDEVVENELGAYLESARYDKYGICDIELVPGFVEESEEGESIARSASFTLSAYRFFGKYYERRQ